jgi:hypothetical protein
MRAFCGLLGVAFCLFLGVPESRADICGSIVHNLVTNCGFETGNFTGWTLSGNDTPFELGNLYGVEGVDPLDGISPHSGSYQAYFADLDANATTLSQTFATVVGGMYTVSWYLAQDTAPGTSFCGPVLCSNEFSASFGAATLVNLEAVPVQGYTEYSYTVTASSASSVLDLTLGNDLGEFLLDDVSVVATPEPAAYGLLATAIAMVGFSRRRAKQRSA